MLLALLRHLESLALMNQCRQGNSQEDLFLLQDRRHYRLVHLYHYLEHQYHHHPRGRRQIQLLD